MFPQDYQHTFKITNIVMSVTSILFRKACKDRSLLYLTNLMKSTFIFSVKVVNYHYNGENDDENDDDHNDNDDDFDKDDNELKCV